MLMFMSTAVTYVYTFMSHTQPGSSREEIKNIKYCQPDIKSRFIVVEIQVHGYI